MRSVPALARLGRLVENLSVVPVVGLALGSTAGWGAAKAATAHYSVMVKDTSQVFVAGPPVVNRLGYDYDKNELGGSEIHTRNGTIDDEAAERSRSVRAARGGSCRTCRARSTSCRRT